MNVIKLDQIYIYLNHFINSTNWFLNECLIDYTSSQTFDLEKYIWYQTFDCRYVHGKSHAKRSLNSKPYLKPLLTVARFIGLTRWFQLYVRVHNVAINDTSLSID